MHAACNMQPALQHAAIGQQWNDPNGCHGRGTSPGHGPMAHGHMGWPRQARPGPGDGLERNVTSFMIHGWLQPAIAGHGPWSAIGPLPAPKYICIYYIYILYKL